MSKGINVRVYSKRVIIYIIGMLSMTLGIIATLYSGVGASSIDSFYSHISQSFDVNISTIVFVASIIFVIISSLAERRIIFIPLVSGFLISAGMKLWDSLLGEYLNDLSFVFAIVVFAFGLAVISLGVAFMVHVDLILTPYDQLNVSISKRTKISFAKIRTVLEVSFLLMAVIIWFVMKVEQNQVMIGTLIISLLIGPLIQVFLTYMKKLKIFNI